MVKKSRKLCVVLMWLVFNTWRRGHGNFISIECASLHRFFLKITIEHSAISERHIWNFEKMWITSSFFQFV